MNENIKTYYEYLINNNEQFAKFVNEIEDLSINELADKFNINIDIWKT